MPGLRYRIAEQGEQQGREGATGMIKKRLQNGGALWAFVKPFDYVCS